MDVGGYAKSNKSVFIATAICGVILFGNLFVINSNGTIIPMASATVTVREFGDEETAFHEFVSQPIMQSNNNASTSNTTIQLPETAKGPQIPTKGYLVQQN